MLQGVEAQDSTVLYSAAIYGAGSTSQRSSFWLHSNQYGTVSTSGNFALAKFAINKRYHPGNPRIIQWAAGIEAVASYGKQGDIFLSDAYMAAKLGPVEVLAGQKKSITGIVDTVLTSGSLSISGNARPIPVIQIAIPEFYPLNFTGGFLSVKASYSDGLLNSSDINYGAARHIPNTYFHQKSVYFRLGNEQMKLNGYAGMNHQAVWGGESEIYPIQEISNSKAYWHTVTGTQYNHMRLGNHFGTIDLALKWKQENWTYFVYRQNVYDTGSLFKVVNFQDGLNGLSIKRTKRITEPYFVFNSFLLEMVYTKNQRNNNPMSGLGIYETANYYNHFIYRNGWSYYGRNMGTPLIANATDDRQDVRSTEFTHNNRIMAFNLGATAAWLNSNLLFRCTYSRNFGTYVNPLPYGKNQFSFIINGEHNLNGRRGLAIQLTAASDIGQLYRNSNSIMLGVKKTGFLN
ncbi:capsule assembly Wzi family protein [Dyadobacter luteus]|uniref:capsule assembly Wzi family protein n=1 Tax=Dyadobacter luteus TaxID=2259619 RepID=UPI001314D534|nr:capsule assembly Wzi family protein [Dyadobacter luteus]